MHSLFGLYITPKAPNDERLLNDLAGFFLIDLFIKKCLGNNEARYRRYKANCVVCKGDDSGTAALSSSLACKDLYGTIPLSCMEKFVHDLWQSFRCWKSIWDLTSKKKKDFASNNFSLHSACPMGSLSTKKTKRKKEEKKFES